MLSFIIAAFLFIGCGAKDADTADTATATETTDTAAAEEQIYPSMYEGCLIK